MLSFLMALVNKVKENFIFYFFTYFFLWRKFYSRHDRNQTLNVDTYSNEDSLTQTLIYHVMKD